MGYVFSSFLFISVEKTPTSASSESGLRMSDLPCQTLREKNDLLKILFRKIICLLNVLKWHDFAC